MQEQKIRGASKTRHPYRRGAANASRRYTGSRPNPLDIDELYKVRGRLRPLAKKEEEIAGRIKYFGPGVYPGHITCALVTEDPRSNVNVEAMRRDHPDLVAQYTEDNLVRIVKVQLK